MTKPEAEAQGPQAWDWVETGVWTERMLAALGNGVKGGKWFGLMDKVYAPRTLQAAWERVASNKGAAGVDRISVERFGLKADRYLKELGDDLRTKRYRPEAVRRTYGVGQRARERWSRTGPHSGVSRPGHLGRRQALEANAGIAAGCGARKKWGLPF